MHSLCLERVEPLRLVGLLRRQSSTLDAEDTARQLVQQWRDYISQRSGPASMRLGVHLRMADGETSFDYFTGSTSGVSVPADLVELQLPAMLCAVFPYQGHVAGLRKFVHTVFANWLPAAGLWLMPDGAGTPEFIERYGEAFDPQADFGDLEILVPVRD